MSRVRRDVDVLKRIVEVRQLQERVQEQALAEATVTARSARESEQAADRRLARRQDAWLGAMRQVRFDPYLMGAFTAAVHNADQALGKARDESVKAEQQRDERGVAFQRAEANTDAAEQVRDTAHRIHRRRREESRLNEVSDSVSRRRPAS